MTSRAHYLEQARILLDLARKMSAKRDAQKLIEQANAYQLLADAIPDEPMEPAHRLPPGTVSQPMQQQQQKQTPDDQKE
jgi:hypothetical protein